MSNSKTKPAFVRLYKTSIFIPRHMIVAGYFGIMLAVRVSVHLSIHLCVYVHSSVRPYFHFWGITWSKYQWIFTRFGVYIDIVEILFAIVNGQILSIFDSYVPTTGLYFHFQMRILIISVKFHQTWCVH